MAPSILKLQLPIWKLAHENISGTIADAISVQIMLCHGTFKQTTNTPITFPFNFMLTSATGKALSYKLFWKFLSWKKVYNATSVNTFLILLLLLCLLLSTGRRENWHIQNYLFHHNLHIQLQWKWINGKNPLQTWLYLQKCGFKE